MIVKMKKITLLCIADQREATLDSLRNTGVLHLKHIQEPDSADLDAIRTELERTAASLSILEPYASSGKSIHSSGETLSGEEVVAGVHSTVERKASLNEEITGLFKQESNLEAYGDFDPNTIKELADSGVMVRLFRSGIKKPPVIPEDAVVVDISRDVKDRYFAVIGRGDMDVDAEELDLPNCSLQKIKQQLRERRASLEECEQKLMDLSARRDAVAQLAVRYEADRQYIEVRDGMGSAESIAYLQGFCPVHLVEKIRDAAKSNGWGLVIDEPEASDEPPTLIKYPRWVKPIKAVFDGLGILPGYREADISMVFLLFFSVFFAMLIGDAGYGILLLLATVYAGRKLKRAPRYPFAMLGILSVCTIVWGILTGNYFGIHSEVLPSFLQSLRLPWLTDPDMGRDHIMKLCFILGAVHLTIAHLWNAVIAYPERKWIAQFGWIALVWTMFYAAGHYVLQKAYPSWILYLFVPGLAAVVLFMTAPRDLKRDWINHCMLPLSVISCFVDVVSYIRLFAVGMASAKVAQSFNDMALGMGVSKVWTVPIIAGILLLGHGLNIILCALGVLVHGIRLNTLEFSLHREMQWSGAAYNPFAGNESARG